jgi:hypothetical protein
MVGKKALGFAIAASVVGLLATGFQFAGSTAEKEEGEVKCAGINSCKGTGACAAADGSHDCAGHNECKGKGWIYVESEEECEEQGGTVVK